MDHRWQHLVVAAVTRWSSIQQLRLRLFTMRIH